MRNINTIGEKPGAKRVDRENALQFQMALTEPQLVVAQGEEFVLQVEDSMRNRIRSESDLPTVEVLGDVLTHKKYNPCAGPIYIEGAKPGDTLVIDILDIVVADTGFAFTESEMGPLTGLVKTSEPVGPFTKIIRHEPGPSGTTSDGVGIFNERIKWNLQPMIGVLGVVPLRPEAGSDTLSMQCAHGGNLDTREFRKGNRVYLPVAQEGALLYAGDVHASQASEFGGTADETRAEITLRCSVISGKTTPFVRVETDTEIIQLNCDRPIEEGLRQAHAWLLDWLVKDYSFPLPDALMNFAVNPDVRCNVYSLSMGWRMSYTVGVTFPKSCLPDPLARGGGAGPP